MFDFDFGISWPRKSKDENGKWISQKDYFEYDKRIGETKKALSVQLSRWDGSSSFKFLGVEIRIEWSGSDHAGPYLSIDFLNYGLIINLYDIRHWNYDENRWMTDEEALEDNVYEETERQSTGKWYFYWRDKKMGPYTSQDEAFSALKKKI